MLLAKQLTLAIAVLLQLRTAPLPEIIASRNPPNSVTRRPTTMATYSVPTEAPAERKREYRITFQCCCCSAYRPSLKSHKMYHFIFSCSHKGCDCLTGFHGPMCEFRDTEFLEKNCTLSCDNKGECRTGMKDISLISQFGSDLEDFNQTHTDTWEHCVCPDGYFGVQCEHELEICPGPNPHVCLHGSKCVAQDETTSLSHSCNCDAGFDSIEKHAGKFCQYTSTAICTKNGQPGVGKANFAFCVNSGTCKAQVEDNESHPGCICDEEFAGDHCEFLKVNVPNPVTPGESSNVANNPSVQSSNSNDVAIIVFGVVLGAIFAAIALVLVQKRKQGKKDFSVGTNIPPTHPTAEKELSGMAVFDSDVEEVIIDFPGIKGNKTMETVEII
jgi:hypothetical protein